MQKARAAVQPPEIMGAEDPKAETEPLFTHGYDDEVWAQIWKEWQAKGAVIFTPGNGDAGVAAVRHEMQTLLLAINPEHAELLAFFVDCATATSMQVGFVGDSAASGHCGTRASAAGRPFPPCGLRSARGRPRAGQGLARGRGRFGPVRLP